jgi:hypothetical protein
MSSDRLLRITVIGGLLFGLHAAGATTLCTSEEEVIFSCTTKKEKTVSLCSSAPLTATAGYLQYRFGAVDQDPELTYPTTREHPSRHFEAGTLMYSGGGGAYLKFKSGEYAYTVFTGIGKGWEKEGVVVEKSGSQLAYLPCQGPWTSEIGPALFEQAKIPEDPQVLDFEIP